MTDDILLYILYLAANGDIDSVPQPEGPFNPSFISYQL